MGIKYVAKAKKRNAVEIMFDYHSLLMSFESETIMRRWVEELRRIASESMCICYYQYELMIMHTCLHGHKYAHGRIHIDTHAHTTCV